jgi:hypothetical protein
MWARFYGLFRRGRGFCGGVLLETDEREGLFNLAAKVI